jgi:methionine-rich copper-binding protein CopC
MKYLSSAIALTVLFASALAQAHSHLASSTPADGSVVKAPTAIELNFSEAVTLTSVSIQKGEEKPQSLGPLTDKPVEKASVTVPALAPGKYVVNYRAVSDDNHVMKGTLRFTVSTSQAADAAPSDDKKMSGMDHSKMGNGTAPHQH